MRSGSNWLRIATAAALLIGVAQVQARLPGTLNFQNITATHVNQTVAEQASNEKEVEVGDIDNDGDLDVVIANALSDFGQKRNKLYRNDGGVLNEVSGAPVIPGFSGADVSRNAFLRDYNNDGWLDIIIVNDANTGGDGGRTKIYMNQHPGGVFSHFTEEGMTRLGPSTGGAACGAVSVDVDDDGDDDLYVGNYPGPSQDTMYLNNGNGFFTGVTATQVPADGDYTVDVAAADLNSDDKIDLLVSNWNPDYIYYNDNLGLGSALGDFSYTGSTHNLGGPGQQENAMEPADFNNDGRMDIYHTNMIGAGDRVRMNIGNDLNNRAQFATVTLPPVVSTVTRKATAADLNNDDRVDVVVMSESNRPAVLRNTSVNGNISFVDWTPRTAFPDGGQHGGWHAAAFDSDGDGYRDILVGGWNNDHLFRNIDSNEQDEASLGGELPLVYNAAPVAVTGAVDAADYILEVLSRGTAAAAPPGGAVFPAGPGQDTYALRGVPSGSVLSVVLNGCSDFTLELLNSGGVPIASSERGGLGIEEALQISAPGGDLGIRITANRACSAVACSEAADCGDQNTDTVRDDACLWYGCESSSCITDSIIFADLGGSFGACEPDGFTNLFDRTHALSCFENNNPCPSINLDAGGAFGDCNPDGFCNLFDANHTLAAFVGNSACTCPSNPLPIVEPLTVGRASLVAVANRSAIHPGQTVEFQVYLVARGLGDLQSYQLHGAVSGGRQGRLEMVSATVEQRRDHVFAGLSDVFSASSPRNEQVLAGLDAGGVAVSGRVYLATFTYQASKDAAGEFVFDLLTDEQAGDQTFLVSDFVDRVEVIVTRPAIVDVIRPVR